MKGSEKELTNKMEIKQVEKPLKNNKIVQLLGTAPSLDMAMWDNPNIDTWACSPVVTNPKAEGHIDKIDLLFEMHHMEYWSTIIKRLNDTGKPIVMQKKVPQIIRSIEYPLKKIQAMVTNEKMAKYFISTIAYMIAFAIYLGYEKIYLFGIHMAAEEEEYSRQRACCDAWLAWGDAKGIEFYLPDESQLFKCQYLYGYETKNDHVFKLIEHKKALQNGLKRLEKEKEEIIKRYNEQNGAILDITTLIKRG